MPTLLPVCERIAEQAVKRLQKCRYAREVIRQTPQHGAWTPKNLQILLTHSQPTRFPALDYPGNPPASCWRIQFTARCHVQQSERDTVPVDTALSSFASEAIKSIADVDDWHNWEQLAVDSSIGDISRTTLDGGFHCAAVPFAVLYRTDEHDPFTVRG